MKFLLIAGLIICLNTVVSFAANVPDFEGKFPKFQINNNVEIAWAATNHMREFLWTYKTITQHFSNSVISNLVAMGGFTIYDEQHGHRELSDINEDTLFYYSKERLCNLTVIPAEGEIDYWNEKAPANHWDKTNHLWEQVAGLPEMDEVEKLGLKMLSELGIGRSNLSQRANGHLITFGETRSRGYYDRRTEKYIDDEITARGINFVRRIDGVDFVGIGVRGGCEIQFGNNAKISIFKLTWPNLQPFEKFIAASQSVLIQFIQDGKAVMTHKNVVYPSEIKSLTITDVTPFYWGTTGGNVYPFAQINATANMGNTNEDIQLYCPILSTNLAAAN